MDLQQTFLLSAWVRRNQLNTKTQLRATRLRKVASSPRSIRRITVKVWTVKS